MQHVPSNAFACDVLDRICLAQYIPDFAKSKKFRCFRPQIQTQYVGYCDDFGPMSIDIITAFISLLDNELGSFPSHKVVFLAEAGRRNLTNAVLLLGSYMIMKLEMSADDVCERFAWLDESCVEGYRDASFSKPDFELTLLDCWQGLQRGRALGWISSLQDPESDTWGMIDMTQYRHLDNPVNGTINVVVPGKFVALPTPTDLGGRLHSDEGGQRRFSPKYYAEVLRDLGVTDIVRLNEPVYDPAPFATMGIMHHDFFFDDCSAPPTHVVDAFLSAVDAASGPVAVHCKAGLGRTGTLIALYLMRSHGFGAREAMGWLRIMRPGCVIGEQQHYLCEVEDVSMDREQGLGGAGTAAGGHRNRMSSAEREALADEVREGVARRSMSRRSSQESGKDAGGEDFEDGDALFQRWRAGEDMKS